MSKILVIDDEQGIRTVLSDVLEDEGFQVEVAADGKSGLEEINKGDCDLVILDVWLPDTSGIEILEIVTKEQKELPVIIISGHANIDIAVKAVNLGAYDFLEKPLSIDKMITVVNNALEISQLKLENKSLKQALETNKKTSEEKQSLTEAVFSFEKKYVKSILEENNNNLENTARILKITPKEMNEKIRILKITI